MTRPEGDMMDKPEPVVHTAGPPGEDQGCALCGCKLPRPEAEGPWPAGQHVRTAAGEDGVAVSDPTTCWAAGRRVPFHESWLGALRATVLYGRHASPRGRLVKERVAQQVRFSGLLPLLVHPSRDLNYRFAVAEFLWIARGASDVAALAKYNKRMLDFSDDGVMLAGAYGPRLKDQWPRVAERLRKDPDTRQAVAMVWRPDETDESKDVPCTVAAQFLLRRGTVSSVWTMRSSDLWLGLPYDAFTFARLTACVAGEAGAQVGEVVIDAGSQHLYAADWEKAAAVLNSSDLARTVEQWALPGFPPTYADVVDDAGELPAEFAPYRAALRERTSREALNRLEDGV